MFLSRNQNSPFRTIVVTVLRTTCRRIKIKVGNLLGEGTDC